MEKFSYWRKKFITLPLERSKFIFIDFAKKIKVVNDLAKRAVQLTQEYINVLAKDENQKQYLLQVIKRV